MERLLHLAAVDPGYVIAALFLVGLAIYYGLQIRHYRRMERLASEVFNLKDLRADLATLKEASKEKEIDSIRSALEDIRGAVARMEQQMEIQALRIPEERSEVPSMGLAELVEVRLRSQGFDKISLVGDLDAAEEDPDGEYRLALEAYREGVAHKGHVLVSGGRIIEEMVKPAYEAFP
jgi:hypothetical protein